jgi:F-type H+-transporting ATPase subunit epsilon
MKVSIYSLKRTLFEGEAEAVNCATISGDITVLDHHRPLITMLKGGTVKVTDAEGKDHYFPVSSGFIEVHHENRVKLLVDEA